jgi:hypothetical protein
VALNFSEPVLDFEAAMALITVGSVVTHKNDWIIREEFSSITDAAACNRQTTEAAGNPDSQRVAELHV